MSKLLLLYVMGGRVKYLGCYFSSLLYFSPSGEVDL